MKKRVIGIVLIAILMGAFITNHFITYAGVSTPPLYVNLTHANTSGVGYGIGDPTNAGKYIWNITTHEYDTESQTYSVSDEQANLYCVNADYGHTWFDEADEDEILGYELYYDIQNSVDRNSLLALNDTMLTALLDPKGSQYKQLLWLFDNYYIPGQTNIDEYLAQAGILSGEYEGTIYYYKEVDGQKVDYPAGDPLTVDDITAIQKMVVWYFTNNANYDYTTNSNWLNILQSDGTYESLSSVSESRDAMAMDLYKYLIAGAQKGASLYTSENNYKLDGAPVSVNTENLVQVETEDDENDKYIVNMERDAANYLIGPIVIEQNNDLGYDIEIVVKNEEENPLTKDTDYKYIYIDADGNKVEKAETELVGLTEGFYVSVPRNKVENVSISVSISYTSTLKKLWLDGTEADGSITLNSEQPLVEIKQDHPNLVVELISEPEEFDLALRKYITALHDKNQNAKEIANIRELNNIELETLSTGTTATYNHRKDPVVVEERDEITYTLRIYNEGNKAGYASKIIDQLPIGLISSTNNSSIVVSKGPDGEERNQYKLQYDTTNNQIVLTLIKWPEELEQDVTNEEGYVNEIQPYTLSDGLDYETIEIKCIIAQEPDTEEDIVLTNIAWIAEAYEYDEKQGIYVVSDNDRDSSPQTAPNVAQNDMADYRGSTTQPELSENEYFAGQQDDDDFEKLVIIAVPKKFDLALFKHIAAISKDQTIEGGEYVTDTGNVDGTYLRAPVITAIDSATGKITYEQDDKAALTVEPGDYVLYTIRVYNEGEIDGYASKIKDTLPIGLEFVLDNEEYNGIWNLEPITDSEGRQVVTTTWYAKGQGAELNAKEGDANYQANLLKALKKEGTINSENPDYIDAQVLCRVVEQATSSRVLVNYAQISDDSDADGNEIEDVDSTPDEWIDNDEHVDDDQDIERIHLQYFDLSIRKFITSVEGKALKDSKGNYTREPDVDVSNLVEGTSTTAEYNHSKQPLAVQVGDKIVYTIRVYNEGRINGYAAEVKDYLPPYLTYVTNSDINEKYGWKLSEDGRIATTTYLANTELKAFDGTELDYADIKIECRVSENAPLKENQTNIAEISEYKYNGNTVEKDIDSTADNIISAEDLPSDEELPSYKDEELAKSYVPGNEDDDDFEKVYVKEFDLALRKFITKIEETEVTARVPQIKIENGTISYEHPKDALTVHVGDIVTYTLRIYNEGEISGYASEITDDIPEYLEYLPEDSGNVEYMWKMYDENGTKTESVEKAVKLRTEYLSKENGEDNLINAFDGTTLDYKDIKISFKVKDPNSNTYIITNHAQISDDADENGNEVNDKDSTPNEWIDNDNHKDDDQDVENVKVEYFDLSLLKFVSKVIVIEDGKETITETGYNGYEDPEPVVKVELHKKKINNVIVKFAYGITIINEGDIAGYATEITDYIPTGLKFEANDNPEWTDEGNNVISTKQLENTLLQPGESATVEVIFTWINDKDNMALKTNTAEISEDKNEYDVPDRDSTPDNKVEGEDDIDIAKVILNISTGAAKTYFMLTLGLLAVIVVGIALIKRLVI